MKADLNALLANALRPVCHGAAQFVLYKSILKEL